MEANVQDVRLKPIHGGPVYESNVVLELGEHYISLVRSDGTVVVRPRELVDFIEITPVVEADD